MAKITKRHLQLGIQWVKGMRLNHQLWQYLQNQLCWMRLDKRKEVNIPYPTGIMLELGNRCNLHCITCPREYQFGKQMDQGFMPLENAKKIIDELAPCLTSIGLTGLGETLLYPHLLEVLQYIKQKRPNLITTISTNAHFIGCVEKMIPLLPYLDSVQFSVDGIGKVYEIIRPNTDFKFIEDNIRRIVQAGNGNTSFMINTIITPENCTGLENVVDFADRLGIPYVNYDRINLASIKELDREAYTQFFHDETYRQLLSALYEKKKTHPGLTFHHETRRGQGRFQDCSFPWHHQFITWDGYLVPCCIKPFPKEHNFGNVFTDGGVMAVLNSTKYQAWRKLWQKNQMPKFCEQCNTFCL